jgi:hypothetical protein
MDRFDRQILDFMRSWAPYGGPPADEVLAEFGMTREELIDRAHLIVATEAARREREQRKSWLGVQTTSPSTDTKRRRNARTKGL